MDRTKRNAQTKADHRAVREYLRGRPLPVKQKLNGIPVAVASDGTRYLMLKSGWRKLPRDV